MAQSRSFKEYIANRFYNEFFTAVSDFLEQNHRDLDISSKRVYKIDRAELSDISVKHVFIENHPGMRISFDVLIEADFEIGETDRHNDRFDEKTQWFKVSCTGDLSNNLSDFAISSIEEYYNKNKQLNPMSDSLVPIIKSEQLEAVAKAFLEKYYREALYTPMAIDPAVLAERMALSVHLKHITPDFSSFGQIFFTDCEAEYYDKDESEFKRMPVNKGAIFVDPDAYFLRNLGSVNNTIVHECVHWDLHRKAFELERLYNEEATQIKCLVVGGINPTKAYGYADTNWKDKLTSFDGKAITYDTIGNPLSYDGWTYTWEEGRQLKSMIKGTTALSFKYNSSGLRTEKTVNGLPTKYTYLGGKVAFETTGAETIHYTYDGNGAPFSMTYGGSEYFYLTNLQGDVTGLANASGATVVSYTYDSWGKLISTTGSLATTLGVKNPYRYRGYRYDTETGLYYLQSRYYNPEIGRFINADDSYILLLSNSLSDMNLYSYCHNNPVMNDDPSGYFAIRRWMVAAPLDMIFMLIPGIGAAFAPIKALARTYGRTALKSKLRTPLISFIKFVSNHAASILSVFKTGISKIPIIGKNLAGKIPIAKLTSAIAGMTSTIIINSIINGLLTNVDMITSIGGAISGILDILFDKKLNNSILVL